MPLFIKEISDSASVTTPRLFLSRIGADFDPRNDRVMGPWCFINAEDSYPEWEDMPFSSPFESLEDTTENLNDCMALFRVKIGELTEIMNTRHSRQYDLAYWWIILGPWLSSLILTSWRRWAAVEKFIKQNSTTAYRVQVLEDAEQFTWNHANTGAFMHDLRRSELFDLWLFSLCLGRLAPDNWSLEPVSAEALSRPPPPPPEERFGPYRSLLRRLKGRMPFWDVPGVGRLWSLAFSLYVSLLPKKNNQPTFHGYEETQIPSRFPKAFLEVLDTAIRLSGLGVHGPQFAKLDGRAKKYRYHPGRLFVTAPAIYNDTQNFVLAHAVQTGERIVRIQHGSNYGTTVPAYLIELTEYLASAAFLTWGWESHGSSAGKFLPVPVPHFSRLANRHKESRRDLVLVGTALTLNPDRYIRNINCVPKYRKDKVLFIKGLAPDVRAALKYRPYKNQMVDLDEVEFLENRLGRLSLVEGPLDPQLLGCRLLVLDHPGSTLHFALAANVPTVCYWNPQEWHIAPEAQQHFDALKNAGIVHETPEAAADHVNSIFPEIEGWWGAEERQKARQFWAEAHARTRTFWWADWMKTLAAV